MISLHGLIRKIPDYSPVFHPIINHIGIICRQIINDVGANNAFNV